MKKILILLSILLPSLLFADYNDEDFGSIFFNRQPSARAEALGKAYASIDGDLATMFYNPAGTATLQGVEINSSYSTPFYMLDDASFTFVSAGYNINRYLTVGASINHFSNGYEVTVTDENGNSIGDTYTPSNSIYSLNLSSQVMNNLFVGLNSNMFKSLLVPKAAYSVYFDLGVIKKFEFAQTGISKQSVNLGTSITNLNFASIEYEFNEIKTPKNDLPVITRYGLNYQFSLNKNILSDSLTTLRVLAQADYQYLLNYDYNNGIHTGIELQFVEILALRFGYYNETNDDGGYPIENKSSISEITYGLGVQIPLMKLKNIPLNINLDYTNLPQPNYSKTLSDYNNFSTLSLRLNWVIHK